MEKVKRLVEAGASIPTAVKECLGFPITDFARKYGLVYSDTAQSIRGHLRPTPPVLAALIAELGGTEEEWRHLLWLAGKPDPAVAESA